jgi:hypothetical protein
MAQVKPGIAIDERQSKVLRPRGAAYNVATEIRPSGEEHDGFKSRIATQGSSLSRLLFPIDSPSNSSFKESECLDGSPTGERQFAACSAIHCPRNLRCFQPATPAPLGSASFS